MGKLMIYHGKFYKVNIIKKRLWQPYQYRQTLRVWLMANRNHIRHKHIICGGLFRCSSEECDSVLSSTIIGQNMRPGPGRDSYQYMCNQCYRRIGIWHCLRLSNWLCPYRFGVVERERKNIFVMNGILFREKVRYAIDI